MAKKKTARKIWVSYVGLSNTPLHKRVLNVVKLLKYELGCSVKWPKVKAYDDSVCSALTISDVVTISYGKLSLGSVLALIEELKRLSPGAKILVLSVPKESRIVCELLAAGACGLATSTGLKDSAKLTRLINDLLLHGVALCADVTKLLLKVIVKDRPQNSSKKTLDEESQLAEGLTPREREVAIKLSRGFSVPDVAVMLGLSRLTIASYTKIIYAKWGVSSRAELALETKRCGLIE